MIHAPAKLYFDFTDPLSYLVDRELDAVEQDLDITVARVAFELRPPPEPITDTADPFWADRWTLAEAIAPEPSLRPPQPRLVPWSRKAHELHLHAAALGRGPAIRRAVFDAFFMLGQDIGRVDLLLEIARGVGLDLTETKAVLDVDRHQPALAEARQVAVAVGIELAPTIVVGEVRLEGFHNRIALSTLLARE
jgi:predicted DsbA family dithiol-disulfide isomerase